MKWLTSIVWVAKYRYRVLVGDIGLRVRELLREICKANGVEIIRGRLSGNHVHDPS